MTFERAEEFEPDIPYRIEDETIYIEDESVCDAIRSVHTYDDGIPAAEVEVLITKITGKLMELEDTNHFEYYNELQDARTLLLSREIPRRVNGWEHVIDDYRPVIESNEHLSLYGLRSAISEGIASIEDPSEDDVRHHAEKFIQTVKNA